MLLLLVVVNGLAAIAIPLLVGVSAGLIDGVIYGNFHEVVTKDGFNASSLKNLSGGPYSDADDWLYKVVLSPFSEHATLVQVIGTTLPAFNAVVCLSIWLMIRRGMRLFRSRLAGGLCTECGYRRSIPPRPGGCPFRRHGLHLL